MKISAIHSTVCRYDFPVNLEPHIFRLRPRMNSAQRLLAFELQITPTPAGTTECLDQDGNLALNAWFNAPTRELSAMSRFTVELLRENPFDYLLIGECLNLPLWYREPLCAALSSYPQDAHIRRGVSLSSLLAREKLMGEIGDRCSLLPARSGGTCYHRCVNRLFKLSHHPRGPCPKKNCRS